MTQTTFASNASPSQVLLDQNFTQLYDLRELISTPSYTAATPKLTIGGGGDFGFGAGTFSFAERMRIQKQDPTAGVMLALSNGPAAATLGTLISLEQAGVSFCRFGLVPGTDAFAFYRYGAGSYPESFRVDSSGAFLVGTTSSTPNPGVALAPAGTINVGNNAGATGFTFQNFIRSATGIGSITQSGTTAVLYNTTSDARLKTNVADAPEAGAIIDAIRVRSFDWRDAENEHVTHGFVAQELVAHAPQAVKVGDTGDEITDTWAVDASKLVPLLVRELQSLRARVAALEARA